MATTKKDIQHIIDIITRWVGKNYGSQEADDPSWNITALAREIYNNRFTIYDDIAKDYVEADAKMVAEKMGVKDRDVIAHAIDEYMVSEAYTATDEEALRYFIQEELDRAQ